jgi:hypothetical protein
LEPKKKTERREEKFNTEELRAEHAWVNEDLTLSSAENIMERDRLLELYANEKIILKWF